MSHTIVLVQLNRKPSSRTYSDFESVASAMDGVCKLYEQRLQQLNPDEDILSYDISDLLNFIDQLGDISCLVASSATGQYVPHDREWIKARLRKRLRQIAA
ncbi:rudimentary enhancer [Thecamonas trahens ATCC 50062]|uniref:Enhancer of rudimentary homolog n=1 Tax=Thecamonas trahens ATCC 50062 TaxID=461836 RepID=A0A0L0DEX0_THETB|nr:rudimentary enhancer [Thecamonas trahens ATCC 50062]KNC50770.1 rudimentary enhancer [Thecamonas trahens ATCC 50062]|eukprot:XP_013756732.1 rudimentary enhancer [Thecamonas trahens ATCC 50062]